MILTTKTTDATKYSEYGICTILHLDTLLLFIALVHVKIGFIYTKADKRLRKTVNIIVDATSNYDIQRRTFKNQIFDEMLKENIDLKKLNKCIKKDKRSQFSI